MRFVVGTLCATAGGLATRARVCLRWLLYQCTLPVHSLHSLSDDPQPIDFRTATIIDEKTALLSLRSAIGLAQTAVPPAGSC